MRRGLLAALGALAAGSLGGACEGPAGGARDPLGAASQAWVDCSESTDTGYVSGSSFDITVVTVDGEPVEKATANAYGLMQAAAAADGVGIVVVSGFRTWAEQAYLYDCYITCSCNGCNLAAPPGYSNHQSGHALDLNTASAGVLAWLGAHAAAYGFSRTVPSEDWHWEWWGGGPGGGPCSAGGGGAGGAGGGGDEPQSCAPATVAGAEGEPFQDMPPGSLGHDEAILLAEAGIAAGCQASPPLFCPGCHATRAEFIAFLVRAAGLPLESPAAATFTDVPVGAPFFAYVETAFAHGITQGCGQGVFCPDAAVTRAQTATLLRRTLGWPAASPASPSFDDVPASHPHFADVETIKAYCVTSGCSATSFCPEEPLTRAQAAVLVARAFDLGDTNHCIGGGGGGAGGAAGAAAGGSHAGGAGPGGAGATSGAPATPAPADGESACSCALPGSPRGARAPAAFALASLGLAFARRRRRRAQ